MPVKVKIEKERLLKNKMELIAQLQVGCRWD